MAATLMADPPWERDIAMMFQDFALFPHMTVAKQVGFGLEMLKKPKAEIAARGAIDLPALAHAFERVRGERRVCITRLPLGWPEGVTRFTGPLDCIGYDGGGGIGSTPFAAVIA